MDKIDISKLFQSRKIYDLSEEEIKGNDEEMLPHYKKMS
jgi:hypothetical protein